MGARVILQTENFPGIVGSVFDAKGVREIPALDAWIYDDGKPCYLLVSADGPLTSPSPALAFCTATIVVTSPNLKPKSDLNAWQKQVNAYQFIAPPLSCPEVVYLLYVECFKLPLLVCLLSKSTRSSSKVWQYDNYFAYWMCREWTKDFRRCRRDCENAISHLKNGILVKWHETKTQSIRS
jgi:hypothetical protein